MLGQVEMKSAIFCANPSYKLKPSHAHKTNVHIVYISIAMLYGSILCRYYCLVLFCMLLRYLLSPVIEYIIRKENYIVGCESIREIANFCSLSYNILPISMLNRISIMSGFREHVYH